MIGVVLFIGVFMFTRSRSDTASTPATPAASQAPSTTPAQPGTATTPGQTPAPAPPAKGGNSAPGKGLPAPVQKALDAKKVVVLLFWSPKAVDDRSVHGSVTRLPHHGGKVAVFTDRTKNLSRYTRITAAASVTQTPSIVIVNRRGAAEVQTGFLDYQTINRYVESALAR